MSIPAPAQMPGFTYGWGGSCFDTNIVDNFWYDQVNQLLYVGLLNGQFNIFLNVPASIGQQFAYTKDPDAFYAVNVFPQFSPALLTDKCQPIVCNGKVLVIR